MNNAQYEKTVNITFSGLDVNNFIFFARWHMSSDNELWPGPWTFSTQNEKALRETQTLHTGCSKTEPKNFAPPQTPSQGCRTANI